MMIGPSPLLHLISVAHKLKTPEVFRKSMLAIEPHMMSMKEDCREWIEVMMHHCMKEGCREWIV